MSDDTLIIKITTYSSMFAGIIGKMICHPLDTIRAKIQVNYLLFILDQINNDPKNFC